MFLNDNIAGRIARDNEALFTGEIGLAGIEQGNLTKISSCRIYEVNYKVRRQTESLIIGMDYIIEIQYEYICKSGEIKSGISKLPGRHDVFAEPNEIPKAGADKDYCVIPALKSADYDYSISADGKSVNLSLAAKLEFIITGSFYSNIYECGRKVESDKKIEPVDWMKVLENVNVDDILTIFENFTRLLKLRNVLGKRDRPAAGEEDGRLVEIENTNKMLTEANRSLEAQLREARDSLTGLKLEINERNGIIDKLLALIEKGG